jgi:Cdc6-like AAA superfamily ATPase
MKPRKLRTAEDWAALRFEANQLFTPSGPVNIAELFAGRAREIRQLIDAVGEQGRHAIIYGERGVGKTSLVEMLRFFIPQQTSTVFYKRKPADPSDSFSSIWMKIFRDIHIGSNGEDTRPLSDSYTSGILPDDVQRELSIFDPNTVPIIVIDEFNEIGDAQAPSLMANTIKGLSDSAANATVIIVGVADSVAGLIEEHHSIDRCLAEIKMPRMSHEELQEILDKRFARLGMRIGGDAKWKIIMLSRGLPSYVHRLGKFAAFRAIEQKRSMATEADVDAAIEEAVDTSQQSLKAKYERAVLSNQPGNLYKLVLLACALSETDDSGYFSPAAVRGPLSRITGRGNITIANFQNHLKDFMSEKRGHILQRIGQTRAYRFRFRDPLMQPFVLMKGLQERLIDRAALANLSFPEQYDLGLTTAS